MFTISTITIIIIIVITIVIIIIILNIILISQHNIMIAPGDELPRELGANSEACLRIVHQCHSVCGKLDNYLG